MRKRFLAVLLTAVLLLSLSPAVLASSEQAQLPYYGDLAATKLSEAQRDAYCAVLRDLPARGGYNNDPLIHYATLYDPGDGVPVMIVYSTYTGSEGDTWGGEVIADRQGQMRVFVGCQVWGWDGANAVKLTPESCEFADIWPEGLEIYNVYHGTDVDGRTWSAMVQVENGMFSLQDVLWCEASGWLYSYVLKDMGYNEIPATTDEIREAAKAMLAFFVLRDGWPALPYDWSTFKLDNYGGDMLYMQVTAGGYQEFWDKHMAVNTEYNYTYRDYSDAVTYENVCADTDKWFESGALIDALQAFDVTPRFSGYETPEEPDQSLMELFDIKGRVAADYQLTGDLRYVILEAEDGSYYGAYLRAETKDGKTTWSTEGAGPLASQEELDREAALGLNASNVSIDYSAIAEIRSAGDLTEAVNGLLDNMPGAAPNDAASRELGGFIEAAVSSMSSTAVTGQDNVLDLQVPEALADGARDALRQAQEAAQDRGVTFSRDLTGRVRVLWEDLDWDSSSTLTIDEDGADVLDGLSLQVLFGDGRHYVEMSSQGMDTVIDAQGRVCVDLSRKGDAYTVTFTDASGNVIDRLDAPVTLALPAESFTSTVNASTSGGQDNWGGQYDPYAGVITFETAWSGTYTVTESGEEVKDIDGLDAETREAVLFMVSKGYMDLTGSSFLPDEPLTRFDFTRALVGMFYALDHSAQSTFTDVPQDSPYYTCVASAQSTGLVRGVSETEFGGGSPLTNEQMLTLAGRTLQEQLGYVPPQVPAQYLTGYTDSAQMSDWAKEQSTIAIREGLIARGGSLEPAAPVTRAHAALILYRLFQRLYTVPPVALALPQSSKAPAVKPGSTGGEAADTDTEAPEDTKESFPWVPVLIGAGAALAVILVLVIVLVSVKKSKKRRAAKAAQAAVPFQPAPPVQPAAPAQRFCTNCGAKLEPGDQFCTSCGEKV